MGLSRSIRVIFSLAVTGGVAAILSGSAFAADSSLSTTSQQNSVVTEKTQHVENTSAATSLNPNSSTHLDVDNEKTSTVDKTAQTNEPRVSSLASSGTDTKPKTGLESTAGSVEETAKPVAATQENDSADSQDDPTASAVSGTGLNAAADRSSGSSPQVQPQESIVFKSQVLVVRPTITNRTAPVAGDLAASLPSAPAKVPHPAHPSGLLGELSAELAATVVPQPYALHGFTAGFVTQVLSLAMLLVVLLNVFTFTYGLWLRRGGFSTAARSNAPNGSSNFAPSLLLDYVSSQRRQHSPFLVVANSKIRFPIVLNALRKEEA